MNALRTVAKVEHFDIIGIEEAWLYKEIGRADISIELHFTYRNDRHEVKSQQKV